MGWRPAAGVLAVTCVALLIGVGGASGTARNIRTIEWSYQGYAHNVRVLRPLVGPWQLGMVRIHGSGETRISDPGPGFLTSGTLFAESIPGLPRYQHTWIRAKITNWRINTVIQPHGQGETTTLWLDLEITSTEQAKPTQCAPGTKGTLKLVDSTLKYDNGENQDFIGTTWLPGCDATYGFANLDGGPRTSPQYGGPPHGGQWAVVHIKTTS